MTTFPIARPALFEWYLDAKRCFWTVEEISVSQDVDDFKHKLSPGEQRFVKHVLAFFAASDGIVNVNLAERFKKDVPILEATYFYNYQISTEDMHAHMYSILLDAIVPSATERNELLNAAQTMPVIARMSEFMYRCIASDAPFAERLLRMACVEGIFFTGCFCAIYWLQSRGLMPALGQSNSLIAKDEALHTMFAMFLYSMIEPDQQLSAVAVGKIILEAVELAIDFIKDALPTGLLEMNSGLMIPYIQCQADNIVTLINQPPIFETKHDFGFMEQQNMTNRANFFERRATEYNKRREADVDEYDVATHF